MKKFKRVYIEITNICNLKCKFCDITNRKQEFMSLENVETILKKVKQYTDFIYLHVKGEPLLHPNIKEILNLAEKYNLQVIITTNGTLLKEKSKILASAKAIRQINISLHSIEQNQELQINKEEYLKEIFESIEEITQSINCYISYRLWNLDNISESEKNRDILNCLKDYYELSQLLEQVKNSDNIKIKDKMYINLDTIYEWPSLNRDIVSKKGSCYGLLTQLAILVDGTVVPCCLDQNGDIALGNILEQDLEEILNSKLAIEIQDGFRNNKLMHPLCQRCGFRELKRR